MRRLLPYADIVFYVAVYLYCVWRRRTGTEYLIGMTIATIGYTLWFTARAHLGRAFSAHAVATELVTRGLYSKIRHPVYLFSTIGIAGLCLAMHWYRLGGAYVLLVAITQWRRAIAETKVLEAKFGDQYREYRAHTWF